MQNESSNDDVNDLHLALGPIHTSSGIINRNSMKKSTKSIHKKQIWQQRRTDLQWWRSTSNELQKWKWNERNWTLYWELSSSLSSGISPFFVVEKYLESWPLIALSLSSPSQSNWEWLRWRRRITMANWETRSGLSLPTFWVLTAFACESDYSQNRTGWLGRFMLSSYVFAFNPVTGAVFS